jgi:2-amino-4-hydroxy-6-hydroxymethyldihydropteridine diphosphokinase
MKPYRAFIGFGSNLGDRASHLQSAATAVAKIDGVTVFWFSPVYETEPYGKTDQPKFLNAVSEIETALAPPALLKRLLQIEESSGRRRTGRWEPREIDLDILLYDGLVYEDETLSVPHKELPLRKFVLVPFREIAPDVVHPVSGMTVEEMAAQCRDGGRVVKTSWQIRV